MPLIHRSSALLGLSAAVATVVVAAVGCQRLVSKWRKRKFLATASTQLMDKNPCEVQHGVKTPPTIAIVYATCGGTAKNFATALFDLLVDREVQGVELVHDDAIALFETRFSLVQPRVVFAVVSTSGDGQIPPSFGRQWATLRHIAAAKALSATNDCPPASYCATLALGDSSYRFFCRAGAEVADVLSAMGYMPLPLGTEEHGTPGAPPFTPCDAKGARSQDAIFSEWCNRVLGGLQNVGIPIGPQPLHPPKCRYDIVPVPIGPAAGGAHVADVADTPFVLTPSMMAPSRARPASLPVRSIVHCLPPTSTHPIVQVTLDLSHMLRMQYEAGDHIGLFVPNPPHEVDRLIDFFAMQAGPTVAERPIRVQQKSVGMARASAAGVFSCATTTLRIILTWYVDISAVPSTTALRHIIRCSAANDHEKLRMLEVLDASPWLMKVCDGPSRRITRLTDVLVEYFPLCASCPLERVFECMPPLQPRLYSIGSDPASHLDGSLQVYVRLVPNGVASEFLASAPSRVFGFIQKSEFHLPRNHQRPLLLIGPGTGLAPLLGFLYRRHALQRKRPNSSLCGAAILMHGCREERDWTETFSQMVKPFLTDDIPVLTTLDLCFSREPGRPRRYVQDALRDRGPSIAQLLASRDVAVFVCGDAKHMAKGVWQTLVDLLQAHAGYSAERAQNLLATMVKEKRYVEDVW